MTHQIVSAIDSMETDRYKAAFVRVTPALAARWLTRNDGNRTITTATVDRYKRDMGTGSWIFTGETVKFGHDGQLLDGQHRLTAIVESGHTALMLVVSGLSKEAQRVMDTGRKRSAADALNMLGQKNAPLMAATARLCVAWNAGRIRDSNTQFLGEISHSEIIDIIESDPYVAWAVDISIKCKATFPANPAAIAFAAWHCGQVDELSTVDFMQSVADFRTNGSGDPRHTLLRRLQSAKDQRERLTSVQQAWLIVKAWKAHTSGADLRVLKLSTSAGPQAFPDLRVVS